MRLEMGAEFRSGREADAANDARERLHHAVHLLQSNNFNKFKKM